MFFKVWFVSICVIYYFCFPYFQGDLRNHAEVEDVLEGVDCVYHMASYGMSGREQVSS